MPSIARVSLMILLCAVSPLAISPSHADDEAGFVPIFDGESLDGWRGEEGFWRVENGIIVGQTTEEHPLNHNTFLVWDEGEVDDFELRLEFRITGSDSANSGIQFRGWQREDGHVIGYQADIDKAGNYVGALYDEARRGMLATRGQQTTVTAGGEKQTKQVADGADLFQYVKQDDWNEYSITARGEQITLKVNGHVTAQVTDHQQSEGDLIGLLALQLHAGPPMQIEFRNIRLKRLPLQDGFKKVVFIAGTPSHGYFAHEHNAGCLLLAKALNDAREDHGLPVVATVYTNGWPKDMTAFDNADTVVSYCDGGGRHYLNDRLDDFQKLVDERHVGLVCIHYAVETTIGECGDHFLNWIGGYFEPNWSVNPHWDAHFDNLPEHPITTGVEPFEINDEWYYHMRFVDGMEGVTPILTDLPPRETLSRPDGPHSGNPFVREAVLQRKEPQHVAWAYERPGGKGRGFGFTGGHFHKNWQDDNFRTLVLNAIVWSAGGDVPEGGVPSETPTQEELDANQDEPKPQQAANRPQQRQPQEVAASEGNAKPAFSSPVVSARTPGHAVDIDVDITGAESLFLVVTDAHDGFSCDWSDWAEPRLVGPDSERKLTELTPKAKSSDWGQVRTNQNAGGGPLRIDGKSVEYGIGTHANSIVEFELPADHTYTRFKARGGVDNGGTDQGGGSTVQFHVFTQRPSRAFLASVSAGQSDLTASHDAADAVSQLDVHEDLQASLFASEPMMNNPTNIDIDHLGRVWICEVINYRHFRNQDIPEREEGDRILILEDTDGDGKADKTTTYYQGRDIDSAHGICVLGTPDGKGTRALVSAGDSVFYLIDDDGDLHADRKEVLFTGIHGVQHDHGIHAFSFGPDGKLYFNFGNEGKEIKDRDGNPIVDMAGNVVQENLRPYQQGMVFRCNMDGSEFQTLAWNFRNNWEVCVDSFGTMWQSDNDDDGNRGVRINYVMEYGNYGYRDELTGAGWKEPRTGWREEIPERHWHLNDPGVVPNLLQTGAGSPTGICVYEGDLLPEVFRGQIIHCDAGPNIVRAYPVQQDGAGYTAEIVNILDGSLHDKWFRPTDVCVAPDGSLIVADWYDPGVGGHRMQDPEHGRLFRVVPKGDDGSWTVPEQDFSTPEGAVQALKSPNLATRYMAWTALHQMGASAVPALTELFESDNPRFRARALGVLSKLDLPADQTARYLWEGLTDHDVDVRIAALRLSRQLRDRVDIEDAGDRLAIDSSPPDAAPSPAFRREALIGLSELALEDEPEIPEIWAALAMQHDGADRWYLEALGIAARGRWDECLAAWLEMAGPDWADSKAGRDIVWRSRTGVTAELLAGLIADPDTPAEELPRYFRSLDFQDSPRMNELLLGLAFGDAGDGEERGAFIQAEALNRLHGFNIAAQPEHREALERILDANTGTAQFVRLVEKFSVADRYDDLLALAQEHAEDQLAVEAVKALFGRQQGRLIRGALRGDDPETTNATITALSTAADGRAVGLLLELASDEGRPLELRRQAVKGLGGIRQGAVNLSDLAENGNYDPALKDALAATLHTVQWNDIKEKAARLFPLPEGKDAEPLPPVEELLTRQGDVTHGRIVFNTTGTCAKCHVVDGIGKEVGPNLSEIGRKLSPVAMYESILFPSAAISHNYETWTVLTTEGDVVTGILVSETPDEIQLKDEKALIRTIRVEDIDERRQQNISLMPADLQKVMSAEDLVDVVQYLTTLREPDVTATGANGQ